jgi:hypothetical protein
MDEQFLARLFGFIAFAVTTAWLVAYLAPIFRPSYSPAPEFNIVMMAVVGIFVSLYNKAKHPKDDPAESDSKSTGEDES